jgi:hypothetical protein
LNTYFEITLETSNSEKETSINFSTYEFNHLNPYLPQNKNKKWITASSPSSLPSWPLRSPSKPSKYIFP